VIQPLKGRTLGKLCHNCRNGTNSYHKVRCDNEEAAPTLRDPAATVRCNKSFCERCLRFWYGIDDNAIEFLVSGKKTSEGGTGTGLGLGLFEGIWLCPWCINLCMCTLCQGRRGGPRTRFRPSSRAKVSESHQIKRSKLLKMRLTLGTLRSIIHIYLPMVSLMTVSSSPKPIPTPADISPIPPDASLSPSSSFSGIDLSDAGNHFATVIVSHLHTR
jgi:hypothetical protein